MDRSSLAQSKAQWASSLQTARNAFKLLTSPAHATSKSWKLLPHGGGSSGSGGGGAPSGSHIASSTSSASLSSSASPGHSTLGRSSGAASSAAGTGAPRRSTNLAHVSPHENGGAAVGMPGPSAAAPPSRAALARELAASPPGHRSFALGTLDPSQVVVHRRSGGRQVGLPSGSEVYRAVAEVPLEGSMDLDEVRALLETPECRAFWDAMTEQAELIELLDTRTRIARTSFKLGWPASPRDAVTIAQSAQDASSFVDVSTSIARSPDAPAYLRPAPPYVRSHVHLFAWYVQVVGGPSPSSAASASASASAPSGVANPNATSGGGSASLRIMLFWSWDMRGAWLGMPAGGLGAQIPALVSSFVERLRSHATMARVPALSFHGDCIEVLAKAFDPSRDTLQTEYQVLVPEQPPTGGPLDDGVEAGGSQHVRSDASEDDGGGGDGGIAGRGRPLEKSDSSMTAKAHTRPQASASLSSRARAIEVSLPAAEGWDVRVVVRSHLVDASSSAKWQAHAERDVDDAGRPMGSRSRLRIEHGALHATDDSVRVTLVAQRVAAASSEVRLRLNDAPFAIVPVQASAALAAKSAVVRGSASRAGTPVVGPYATVDDAASVSGLSLLTAASSGASSVVSMAAVYAEGISRPTTPSSVSLHGGGTSSSSQQAHTPQHTRSATPSSALAATTPGHQQGGSVRVPRAPMDRGAAVASLIKRNYIYFTSLLQEPEAKWRRVLDQRGVTVTQLDSIDATLVVYRAEATFVGVSVWDLFAVLSGAGARAQFERGVEEARLVEDLGDASKLWWTKTRAAWPVSARDAVMVETTYKSPASVHLFGFSTEERGLFPLLPPPEPATIRTQVDLRGWSLESLSPTTVHVTLLEQSDPRGWTSKSATPATMVASVAGAGDFAIHSGAPPVATRLLGARTRSARYSHEKGTYRLEYELAPVAADQAGVISAPAAVGSGAEPSASSAVSALQHVECELRCDVETWAPAGLDLVVDPPPVNVSCLRRHKLSQGGSGLWLTIEHVAASLEDETARIVVRRAASAAAAANGNAAAAQAVPPSPTTPQQATRPQTGGGAAVGAAAAATAGAPASAVVVQVNGARVRIDVDEMREEEMRELRERKRTKPKRVPLDVDAKSATLRGRRGAGASAGAGGSDHGGAAGGGMDEEASGATTPQHGGRTAVPGQAQRSATPLSAVFGAGATAGSQGAAERDSPSKPAGAQQTAAPPAAAHVDPPRPPMASALDVLFLLRRIHAERSADPAGNPAGWALVWQRNGLYVRRKLMESISRTVVVHRADKVAEGVTAEELSALLALPQARSAWDERVESCTPLQSYGSGAHTCFYTTRAAFPFRGRGFYVASLAARSLGRPAAAGGSGAGSGDGVATAGRLRGRSTAAGGGSSRDSALSRDGLDADQDSVANGIGTLARGDVDDDDDDDEERFLGRDEDADAALTGSALGARQPVLFHASASFDETRCGVAPSKLNGSSLPVGKVLIDGWILETLDPYSSELNYPIPSTRITHLVAVDYAGSLPATVNAMWNAPLPRAVATLEEAVRARGVPPRLRAPPPAVEVLGSGRDEDAGMAWRLTDSARDARPTTLIMASLPSAANQQVGGGGGGGGSGGGGGANGTGKSTSFLAFFPPDRPSAPRKSTAKTAGSDADGEEASRVEAAASKLANGKPAPAGPPNTITFPLDSGESERGSTSSALKPPMLLDAPARPASPASVSAATATTAAASHDVHRATSISSIRSAASSRRSARPSILRVEARRPRDVALLDVEVDLRQYPHGYSVEVFSELLGEAVAETGARGGEGQGEGEGEGDAAASTVSTTDDGGAGEDVETTSDGGRTDVATTVVGDSSLEHMPQGPAQTDGRATTTARTPLPLRIALRGKAELPVQVAVYDLPPSGVMAATLDPSARPRRHLVRAYLPTATFLTTPASERRVNVRAANPSTAASASAPAWFGELRRRGAAFRLVIKAMSAEAVATAMAGASGAAKGNVATVGGGGAAKSSAAAAPLPSSSSSSSSASSPPPPPPPEELLDSQQVPVLLDARVPLEVAHVNVTSALLQREGEEEGRLAVLQRAALPKSTEASSAADHGVPQLLREPLAHASQLMDFVEASKTGAVGATVGKAGQTGKGATTSKSAAAAGGAGADINSNRDGGGADDASRDAKMEARPGTPLSSRGPGRTSNAHTWSPASTKAMAATAARSESPGAGAAGASGGGSATATATTAPASSSTLMNVLNSYPLSRLGAAAVLSPVVANGGIGSSNHAGAAAKGGGDKAESVKAKDGTALAVGADKAEKVPAGDAAAGGAQKASHSPDAQGTAQGSGGSTSSAVSGATMARRVGEWQVSVATLLLVALCAFLLGSLARSMLEPADFVLSVGGGGRAGGGGGNTRGGPASNAVAQEAVAAAAMAATAAGGETSSGEVGGVAVAWREIRRLVEVTRIVGGWDLVIAVVRR